MGPLQKAPPLPDRQLRDRDRDSVVYCCHRIDQGIGELQHALTEAERGLALSDASERYLRERLGIAQHQIEEAFFALDSQDQDKPKQEALFQTKRRPISLTEDRPLHEPTCKQCNLEMDHIITLNGGDEEGRDWIVLYQCPKCKTVIAR